MNFFAHMFRCRGQRFLSALVLALLLCTVAADQPATLVQGETVPASLHTLIVPPAAPHPLTRRRFVREVDRKDWYLLDGDQLLPVQVNNYPDVLEARWHARMQKANAQSPRVNEQNEEVHKRPSFLFAKLFQPAPESLTHVHHHPGAPPERQHQQQQNTAHSFSAGKKTHSTLVNFVPEDKPVTAAPSKTAQRRVNENARNADKIALQSLRLVVHLADASSNINNEDEDKQLQNAGADADGGRPPVLQVHPRGGLRAHQSVQRPSVSPTAFKGQPQLPPFSEMKATSAGRGNPLFDADIPPTATAATSRHVYTDEVELNHRCLVANGRATEPAVLRAMLEGRLRNDCLIVAADVGNDIPTDVNNTKGAIAIVSFFVSTLFFVFALIF